MLFDFTKSNSFVEMFEAMYDGNFPVYNLAVIF